MRRSAVGADSALASSAEAFVLDRVVLGSTVELRIGQTHALGVRS